MTIHVDQVGRPARDPQAIGARTPPLTRLRLADRHWEIVITVPFHQMVERADWALQAGELILIDAPGRRTFAFNPRHLISIEQIESRGA